MIKVGFKIILVLLLLNYSKCQDQALEEKEQDICNGRSFSLNCGPFQTQNTNFTGLVTEAVYGVHAVPSTVCDYNNTDCFDISDDSYCNYAGDSCSIYASSSYKIEKCGNKIADYLHVRYRCLPISSSIIKNYDVCDRTVTQITDSKGFISSPNYPTYQIVNDECMQKIVVPNNKVINLWVMVDMAKPDENEICSENYVKITDNTGTYRACGYRKFSFQNMLCSSVIYISYLAPKDLTPSFYRGFRLYYETADRTTQPFCPTNTPSQPTTPFRTTTPRPILDLSASIIKRTTVCKGNQTTITVPDGYSVFIIDSFYGVTNDQTCGSINPQNCKSPYNFFCSTRATCSISLLSNIPLADCSNRPADYLQIQYRFVPVVTRNNGSICDSSDIVATSTGYGIITNPNFPTWTPNQNCKRKIIAPAGYSVRVLVTDINMESADQADGQCKQGYLEVNSECDSRKYCGRKTNSGSYSFTTCSNYLTLSYVTSTTNNDYRGVNLYYEIIKEDGPSAEYRQDICSGSYGSIKCRPTPTANYTSLITQAFYGLNTVNTSSCQYSEGDCTEPSTDKICVRPEADCEPYAYSYEKIPECGNAYGKYLHLRYKCVPLESVVYPEYNICDKTLKDITDFKGFIQSPNYPRYTMVPNVCTQKIVVPNDKTVNIYFANIDMKSTNEYDQCAQNYVTVSDSTGSYSYCGWRKVSLENQLCSSTIYVSYAAPADLSTTLYTGFKLYFEVVDRNASFNCPTGTPASPTPPVYTTTSRPLISDLQASYVYTLVLCFSESKTIEIPTGFSLFPIEMHYGVTDTGLCANRNPQNCKTPTKLSCSLQGSCTVSFTVNQFIPECSNKYATYLELKYRFIPLTSTKNRTMCLDTTINGNQSLYGVITNENYPTWQPNKLCSIEINAPPGRLIRLSINDLNIEAPDNGGQCQSGFLQFKSDCDNMYYCGDKQTGGSYMFTSCSNKMTISYKATSSQYDLRGFNVYYEVIYPEISGNENRVDVCVTSSSLNLECATSKSTNFTAVVTSAIYGIPNIPGSSCIYNEGDCSAPSTDNYCNSPLETCYLYPSEYYTLSNCGNRKAEYLHVRYKCIPVQSTTIPQYNICDKSLKDIKSTSALISSPGYPFYGMVPDQCTQKIVAPDNKIINLWFSSIDMKSPDSSQGCVNDYVMVTDNTGSYTACGYRKYSLEKKLCSSVVYVSYKAPSNLSTTFYRGFQLYYEFVDRSTQPGCPSNTPATPTPPKPPTTTFSPTILTGSAASVIYKQYICRNNEATIQVPSRFQLFPINAYYGVTPDQTCNTINPQNCKTPTTVECKLDTECKITFQNLNIPISDCGGKNANYIGFEYRFVPLQSTRNYTVCDTSDIDGGVAKFGVITQPNYPNWEPNKNCKRRIVAPAKSYIRVYISDINMELPTESNQKCEKGYLNLDGGSGCENKFYCGEKSKSGSYVYTSCSNTLTIQYLSSNAQNMQYRGFNLYFEILNSEVTLVQHTKDACPGTTTTLTADPSTPSTNFTIVINEAIYGVKPKNTTTNCVYDPKDCTGPSTEDICTKPTVDCSYYNYYYSYVGKCNGDLADYLHIRYKYIPIYSGEIDNYNICDKSLTDITDPFGFIDSPNYPTYSPVMDECTQKIVAPSNKVIKLWFSHLYIKNSEPNNDCKTDYVKIVDSVGTYKVCGERKYSFENLCASQIFVIYKAPTASNSYKGFRIFYEFVDRSTQPNCPTVLPTLPTLSPVITPPSEITDVVASDFIKEYVCKGKEKVIDVPAASFFLKINVFYGYTPDPNCQTFNPTDCNSPAPLTCVSGQQCTVALYNEIEIDGCNGQTANYIGLEYRFIPLYTTRNYSICENTPIDGSKIKAGVITNTDYPNVQYSNTNCARNITVPEGYAFRAYITDVDMEPKTGSECFSNYLALDSNTVNSKYCGQISGDERDTFLTCSNVVTVTYRSTTANKMRGFNMYFEIIEKGSISCPVKTGPTKPATRYVTVVNDEMHKKHSNHLTGWSLGLGIPLLIVIVVGVWWCLRKGDVKKKEPGFAFSKFDSDI